MRSFSAAFAGLLAVIFAGSALAAGTVTHAAAATIHLTQTPISQTFVDLGAKGPSVGDLLVLQAELRTPATGKAVGHAEGYCVLLVPASQSYQCQIQNVLAGGTIIGTGPFSPGKPGFAALTGTGAYAGISGQATITPKNAQGALNVVFKL
jgi:hypothetical protein